MTIIRMNSRRDKKGNIIYRGVEDRVGLHPVHIRRMIREKKFPAPVRLGPRSVGWLDDELTDWEDQRRQERDAKIAGRAA